MTAPTLTYLTLDELEAIAFAHPGFDIVAAQGPCGPVWLLRVLEAGKEVLYRAHRPVEVAS